MSKQLISKAFIEEMCAIIRNLYLESSVPWVIGYSGGKDSTATLQLVWLALRDLPAESRNHKPVHVISTDTLVEQPIVAAWVNKSLETMQAAAEQQGMPIIPHRLIPKTRDTYWVKLIGQGYPAPRQQFRWCTFRLKIEPSNTFILDTIRTYGETVLVLGTRKGESVSRGINMRKQEETRVRKWLSKNKSLANSWIFSPIEDWSTQDVWTFLMQYPNPWGLSNKDLLTMYRGATADTECPLVLDESTPSCGNSRFGCWVCTLVSSDKSMEAMIQNDDEKEWMLPLLELRNEIASLNEQGRIDDFHRRDFRRMDGSIKINPRTASTINGPYTKEWRERWLRRLLTIEKQIQDTGPEHVANLKLITDDELREIRRIWLLEKHSFDDKLPEIYEETTGVAYPFQDEFDSVPFGKAEWQLLEEVAGGNKIYHELLTSLIDVEQRSKSKTTKKGLITELEAVIKRCYFENQEDAIGFEFKRKDIRLENKIPTSYLTQLEDDEVIEIDDYSDSHSI